MNICECGKEAGQGRSACESCFPDNIHMTWNAQEQIRERPTAQTMQNQQIIGLLTEIRDLLKGK